MAIEAQNQIFRAFLEILNAEQRRAVERTEGPVVVIAGPGTGKTQMLAARVGKILIDTDTRAQNILCLTFTDAGVYAMRQRLLQLIGPEAHRVPVYTFHAFCNRIIQENLEFFGRAALEPLSDLERIQLVRELLAGLSPGHPLRAGQKDVFQFETQLRSLFAVMKKEGWTAETIQLGIQQYLTGLPERPEFIYQRNNKHGKKGEPKMALLESAREKMKRLEAAANLYPAYQSALGRAGRYEYEDMLLWVIKAFEQNEALLRTYQERFLYFLVDEYQDTNGAQNRLLHLLIDFWESPNVLIVGDDDQSIYEFQGARLHNLVDFCDRYSRDLELIVLQENYRSPQILLDYAQRLIGQNNLRVVNAAISVPASKNLIAANRQPAQAPQFFIYENRLQELAGAIQTIQQWLDAGIPAKEIAVLYAKHRQAERFMSLLEKKGIPYETRRPVNILDLPLIIQFRELLHYLFDEHRRAFSGEARLFRLLHAPFFGIEPLTLAQISPILGSAQGAKQRWRETLVYAGQLESLPESERQRAVALSNKLEQWIGAISLVPLPMLIEKLYYESGLLAYVLNLPDRVWWLEVLGSFLQFVEQEVGRKPRFDLGQMLGLLDSMDDNHVPLNLQQLIRPAEGIQLLTAHSAKGREFDAVLMLDCTADFWEPGTRGSNRQFTFPDTLTLSGEEDALEARRRLFYVAITRARKELVFSAAKFSDEGKPLNHTRFIDESGLTGNVVILPADALVETRLLLISEPEKPIITLPESSRLEDLLEKFVLSITSLNRLVKCPLSFYFTDVLQIPETVSESGIYGYAVHNALQQYFLKIKTDPQLARLETLLDLFVREMENSRGLFSAHAFEQRKALGLGRLEAYYHAEVRHWTRKAVVERRIDRVEIDGVPVTGVLDKIEWTDTGLRIVDYKTGFPNPGLASPPDAEQPFGGPYWRQLAFYQILLENAGFFTEPVEKLLISWVETDKKQQFPKAEFAITSEHRVLMRELVKSSYNKILNKEFTTGCGEADCVWCKMFRERSVEGVRGREEEGLDDLS